LGNGGKIHETIPHDLPSGYLAHSHGKSVVNGCFLAGKIIYFYGPWLPWLCNEIRGYWGCIESHIQWEFQDPKMEVLYHIRPYFAGIFTYIGLKNRPKIYGRYLQSIGSWIHH